MTRDYNGRGLLWVATLTLGVTIVASLITIAVFMGRLDARVRAIEIASPQRINQREWDAVTGDLKSRLDRIENKIDQHMAESIRR